MQSGGNVVSKNYNAGIAITLFLTVISGILTVYYNHIGDYSWSLWLFPFFSGLICTIWIAAIKRNANKQQEEYNGTTEIAVKRT